MNPSVFTQTRLVFGTLLAGLLSPCFAAPARHPTPDCCGAPIETALASGKSVYDQDYAWETDRDTHVRLGDLRGRVSVVSLFYTDCHVACPVIIQILLDVDHAIPAGSSVRIVLITMDPAVDTAQVLAECRKDHGWSGRVLLLRGSPEATRQFADAAGLVYRKEPARLIHSPKIVVLGPSGRVIANFLGLQSRGADIAQAAVQADSVVTPNASVQ